MCLLDISLSLFIMNTSTDSETSDQDIGLGDDPSIGIPEAHAFEPVLADVQLSDSDTGDGSGDEPGNQRIYWMPTAVSVATAVYGHWSPG